MASPTLVNRNGKWSPFMLGGASFGLFEVAFQAAPTALTDISVVDSRVVGVAVYNSTAGALTFTLQSKEGSPTPLPASGSYAAGASVILNIPFGILSLSGISVQASGAGLYYSLVFSH